MKRAWDEFWEGVTMYAGCMVEVVGVLILVGLICLPLGLICLLVGWWH